MISEITNENGKRIIYLHMEQVFINITKEFSIINDTRKESDRFKLGYNKNYMQECDLSHETITCLEEYVKMNENNDIVIDFGNDKISNIQNQCSQNLRKLLQKNNIKVVNIESKLASELQIVGDNGEEDYISVFENNYPTEIGLFCEDTDYESVNGIKLSRYINVKYIIERQKSLFKWCYLLANKIIQNKIYRKNIRNESKKPILLAHTMNGACIATTLSKLLDLDINYIDHLGPYNRINGINFSENYKPYQNYLVVVDVICQGNEIIRAENIIDFIGGNCLGFVGMVKLDISQITDSSDMEKIKECVANISSDVAVKDLKYTIKTKLCCSGVK